VLIPLNVKSKHARVNKDLFKNWFFPAPIGSAQEEPVKKVAGFVIKRGAPLSITNHIQELGTR
jgi:hypothetical protein